MNDTFKPTDKTRAILQRTTDRLSNDVANEFFDFWEAEDDPRRAGSVVAHRYLFQAARVAIFGAMCAGQIPNLEFWLATCREKFNEAMESAQEAFKDEQPDQQQS